MIWKHGAKPIPQISVVKPTNCGKSLIPSKVVMTTQLMHQLLTSKTSFLVFCCRKIFIESNDPKSFGSKVVIKIVSFFMLQLVQSVR